ncbi:unnamed protein product [Darwinula stevensoni]|uniref:Uncharacterized protein n=1 Tax=Darwinula stevensoni TaxID=69355 RepID=A0A7R9FQP0_9CRUS|nr:unnamed protein product [Darwinula stevensoni]CAG0899805.1 unnamed protein product [Darwinula stevensoni]
MDGNRRQSQIANILARHVTGLKFININGVLEDMRAQGVIERHEFFGTIRKSDQKKLLFLQNIVPLRADKAFPALLDSLGKRGHIALAKSLHREIDFGVALRHFKSTFKDKSTLIDVNLFIDALAEKGVISVAQEIELKRKKTYNGKVDAVFFILFQRNPKPTFQTVVDIMSEMRREDIVLRLQQDLELLLDPIRPSAQSAQTETVDSEKRGNRHAAHSRKLELGVSSSEVIPQEESDEVDGKATVNSLLTRPREIFLLITVFVIVMALAALPISSSFV